MSFDWKTEESDWDKPTRRTVEPATAADELYAGLGPVEDTTVSGPEATPTPRRTILFLFITLILMAAVGGIILRQVERRASEGRERAEADVLASHELVRSAAEQGDTELFAGVLSGRDPQWAEAQTILVANKALASRSEFGFMPNRSGEPDAASPAITLSPDLNSAELSTLETYELSIGSGLTETITLSQTVVYRRGPDRWLLSPPEPEYWGENMTIDGRHIRIVHPNRDRAIAQRLARDLEAIAADLCTDFLDGCPSVELALSPDPATLNGITTLERRDGTLSLNLPAPSLFGVPTDEAGYRAISRSYAERVITAAVRDYTGWTCCENGLLYDALNDASLSRHGLLPLPLTQEQFGPVLQHLAPLDTVAELWLSDQQPDFGDADDLLLPFVDFLAQEARTMPIVEMQRLLMAGQTISFWDWLSTVTGNRYADEDAFVRDWLQYSARQYPTTPGVSLPDQDLQLICRPPGALRASLYRYDPDLDILSLEHELAALDAPIIVPLPNRSGVVVFGRNHRENATPPHLWRDGRVIPVTFEDESVTGFIALPPVPGAENLTFFLDSAASPAPFAVLPLDGCDGAGVCHADMVLGWPVPSPDQSHSIFVVGAQTPLLPNRYQPLLYLGDEQGENMAITGHGWSPFWLDDDTYGFIMTSQGTGRQAVVLLDHEITRTNSDAALSITIARNARLPLMQPRVTGGTTGASENEGLADNARAEILLTTDELVDSGLLVANTTVMLDRVLADPRGENLFIFTANPLQPDVPGQAIVYKLNTGEVETLFEIPGEPFDYRRTYRFSPDGRWLAVGSMRTALHWTIYLHDLDTGNTIEYALSAGRDWPADWLIDWSSDGRWLAITTGGYVRLVAPDLAYSTPLVLDDAVCTAAAWVNEG